MSNLGFELEDPALPGLPENWALSETSGMVRAAYGPAPGDPIDGFESGWGNDGAYFEFGIGTFEFGLFGGTDTSDGFEEGWTPYSFALTGIIDALFGGDPNEEFESGWSNDAYITDFEPSDLEDATFAGTGTAETFESGWDANDLYKVQFVGIGTDLAFALYDGGFDADEDFESVQADRQITVIPAADEVFLSGHGLLAGDRVSFRNEEGQLPEGILDGFVYQVDFVVDANRFRLRPANAPVSTTVDIIDFGFGAHFLVADKRMFWTTVDS